MPHISSDFKHFLRTSTTEDLTVLSRFTKNLDPAEVRALSREIQKRADSHRDVSRGFLKTAPDRENYPAIAAMLEHAVQFQIERELEKKNRTVGDVQG